MEIIRRILSLAAVATIACLLSLPSGVHVLPVGLGPRMDRLKTKELPLYNTHKKNRYSRETSESIVATATTSQLPPAEEESSEGSGIAEAQGVRCMNNNAKSQCRTLKERLVEYFDKNMDQPPLDSFYNSFLLEDIHNFGLLDGDSTRTLELDSDSERSKDKGNRTCAAILELRHRPQSINAGICSWRYSCSYDPNRFPRYLIQATLFNPEEYTEHGRCELVTMSRVTYFQREECPGDPCRKENWMEMVMNNIVVGYVNTTQS